MRQNLKGLNRMVKRKKLLSPTKNRCPASSLLLKSKPLPKRPFAKWQKKTTPEVDQTARSIKLPKKSREKKQKTFSRNANSKRKNRLKSPYRQFGCPMNPSWSALIPVLTMR